MTKKRTGRGKETQLMMQATDKAGQTPEDFYTEFMRLVRPAPKPVDILNEVRRRLDAAPWRCLVCPQRRCRRRRRCNPRDLICLTKVMSRAQQDDTLARLNRALKEHGG
jgi:hypothetical protein